MHTATLPLALIMSFRMLGLFMILPIFAVYAPQFTGATPLLIGLAMGAYGFTQALCQLPFGLLSDKFGRKPMLRCGLLLFAAGSVIAALSHSIFFVILGRFVQGAGAIGSVVNAAIADLTPVAQRSKAMALLGAVIGLSFMIALFLGPLLNQWIHLRGIFWLMSGLALVAFVLLQKAVPAIPQPQVTTRSRLALKQVIKNRDLLRLNASILCLHFILTANFLVVPMLIAQQHINESTQSLYYVVILVLSFFSMLPLMIWTEKKGKPRSAFLLAFTLLLIAEISLLQVNDNTLHLWATLFLFFVGFNLLEASIPAWVSRRCPQDSKGAAMGVHASAQFFGMFLGGICAGIVFKYYQISGVLGLCLFVACICIAFAATMNFSVKQDVKT